MSESTWGRLGLQMPFRHREHLLSLKKGGKPTQVDEKPWACCRGVEDKNTPTVNKITTLSPQASIQNSALVWNQVHYKPLSPGPVRHCEAHARPGYSAPARRPLPTSQDYMGWFPSRGTASSLSLHNSSLQHLLLKLRNVKYPTEHQTGEGSTQKK